MEFHISRSIRERIDLDDLLFSFTGNVVFANVMASRKLAERLNALEGADAAAEKTVSGASLFAMGLIDELSHALIATYRKEVDPAVLSDGLEFLEQSLGAKQLDALLLKFVETFPNVAVYRGKLTAEEWLKSKTEDAPNGPSTNREAALEELLLLWLANSNPALANFKLLFGDEPLKAGTAYPSATAALPAYFEPRPRFKTQAGSLLDLLRAPFLASPDSLTGQLDYIREHWTEVLGEDLKRVLLAIDVLREEEIAVWMRFHPAGEVRHRHGDPGRSDEGFFGDEFVGFDDEFIVMPDGTRRRRYEEGYQAPLVEYEAFSADQAWMPSVVLIAKNTYVWLEQLSKKYQRDIRRLDQIPDEELRQLAERGMTGLWLIGLWERSAASKIIKRLRGNSDAVASAYSLKDYRIADDLGGEAAYLHLKEHAGAAGLRLASDMVPNHMGIDSDWVIEHPDWFISRSESPFPAYRFEGPDVSTDSRVEIKIEDHYYDNSDAAVVFRLRKHSDGSTRFIYHGNDGTTFAWNDTAQIDYSKAAVRESVMQVILDVARRFPIIRFDAAMVLAKRHVQRLWFPLPGAGGSIPSRAEDAMSQEAFDALMPLEFWREVVDRVAVEVPGTLLLAEAFWLLESYFVRTLGMHRVYNSAFMNMLRDEENAKYRSYLKKTVEFDPDILKRYVNFMSNPDERTAIDQFGSGDKYFGVSVLLATLPGLPMFGHGQVEGFTERYGMDFKQARMDEYPNEDLVARHQHLIAPLLKNRHIFAESEHFLMYDFWTPEGVVDENVFAYSNRRGDERALILYNNSYESTRGTVHMSVEFLEKATGSMQRQSLAWGLNLWDESAVIACVDNVLGLEYLYRAWDLRDHGLTVNLRGYQHMALLQWRELRSTAAHPWDRLCDALHGSGVYSLDEALSKLQVQPLLEALRGAVNGQTIETFAKLAKKPETLVAKVVTEEIPAKAKPAKKKKPEAVVPAAEPLADTEPAEVDAERKTFLASAHLFKERVLEYVSTNGVVLHGHRGTKDRAELIPDADAKVPEEATGQPVDPFAALVASSLNLLSADAALSEAIHAPTTTSARTALTGTQMWAPVLAWLVFQDAASEVSPVEIFDALNLRWALAETFSSVGFEGESAWKAAAQIGVLLRFAATEDLTRTLQSEVFWRDPDVRWLAGVNNAAGKEYINQERFEELLRWMAVPSLIETDALSAKDLVPGLVAATKTLKQANFEYDRFLEAMCLPSLQEKPVTP
jgi:glycosidase